MPYLYQDKDYPTYVEQRGAELLYSDYIYKVKADPALRDPNDFPAKRLVNTLFEVRKQALDMMAQTGMDQNVLLQDKKKKQQQKEPKKKENQHQTKETSTEREEGHQAPKQKKRAPKKADRPTRKEEIIQINSHFKIKRTAETNDEEIKAAHLAQRLTELISRANIAKKRVLIFLLCMMLIIYMLSNGTPISLFLK